MKMSAEVSINVRLVFLGGGGVGKTSIVKRFLFNSFPEKYRPTVEDLFFKEFNLGTVILKVDFLDTAGDLQFPAMRRLSITNAQAFVLVYSVNDPASFDIVKACFEEIREVRSDFQEIPIMFVGNKSDVSLQERLVPKEDVAEWVFCQLPKLRTKVIECSAKTNTNIRDMFKAFLSLARVPVPSTAANDDACSLSRRRSSAHASPFSKMTSTSTRNIPKTVTATNSSTSSRCTTPNTLSPHAIANQEFFNEELNDNVNEGVTISSHLNSSIMASRLKPRSRSLIRRTSKKVNKVKDPNSDPEDCIVS